MTQSTEYQSWSGMKRRCINKTNHAYSRYGGRGINICDRWITSFENFYSDMGHKPEGYSIERINNDGNYEPDNCKWATPAEQSKNKRMYKNNKSGATGVTKVGEKWNVTIRANTILIHVGIFETFESACIARKKSELKYW